MILIRKKWRELPKEERLDIPIKKFSIPETEIKRIREINNSKTKLIESAKLQYKLFGDIHSYLTAWVAGYGSDVIIRQKFGSTQNLFKLFFKKIEYPKDITPSWSDIKRQIKLPREITGDLAEETGIHIGDGNMYNIISKEGYKVSSYTISGDLKNEGIYHKTYLKNLIKKIYGVNPTIIERPSKNCIDSRIKSKLIIEFKKQVLGLISGNKKNIKIPKQIIKNNELSKRCAAGIIDTDFNITSSLAITGKLNSLFVVDQLSKIFTDNNIFFKLTKYKDYGRFYIKKEGAIKIIRKWKLKNAKHISKYECHKKFKDIFPYSTTLERLSLLNGELKVEELREICKKRNTP